jgi:hypothetical protein
VDAVIQRGQHGFGCPAPGELPGVTSRGVRASFERSRKRRTYSRSPVHQALGVTRGVDRVAESPL